MELLTCQQVLVIDDDEDNLEVVSQILTFWGYKVITASNGAAGLEALETCNPPLILLDLSMPAVDGWTVLKTIRAREPARDVRVVALTAHAMRGDRERVLKEGFDAYVSKPIDLQEFEAVIRSILINGHQPGVSRE